MDFFNINNIMIRIPLWNGYDLSWIEAIGTFFGLLCIWLASKEKISTYACALINVTLFAVIYFQSQLYANTLLQLFFFCANIYGWYAWSKKTVDNQAELKISWLPLPYLVAITIITSVAILLVTFNIDAIFAWLTNIFIKIMQKLGVIIAAPEFQPDPFPFWDSTIMILSMVAQILMSRKYVENWIIWTVVNIISAFIMKHQGLYFMAALSGLLTILTIHSSWRWSKMACRNNPSFQSYN